MAKQAPRTFAKYQVRVNRSIVYGGITERTLEERLGEHQRKWPNATISQVGPRVTEKTARQWEKDKGYT